MNNDSIIRSNIVKIDDRSKASFSGIVDVISFTEDIVVLSSDLGEITVKGSGLKVTSFSGETGNLELLGRISAVGYTDDNKPSSSFIKRLFR